jgi:hypothetical protein
VSEQFINRVARIAERNKGRLLKEMQENEHVMTLLKKARSNELFADEKERVREELIRALKAIPTFVIRALPQRFLTLPILLKIFPKNLFAEGVVE